MADSPRILVVDDNALNRELLVQILEDLGYAVDEAGDGYAAVDQAARADYVAILMDCEMPGLDGYDATRRIRRAPSERRVPIIAVTGHSPTIVGSKVAAAGMDGCLGKPVDEDELDAALRRVQDGGSLPPAAPSVRPSAPHRRPSAPDPGPSTAILDLFVRLVPEQIGTIAKAVELQNIETLRRDAHKLKGSCVSVGALAMAEVCRRLENDLGWSEAEKALADLEREFAAFKA